ncbi:hypothetical protein [Rhodococcus erythropolis]|uniref:hypothetical protein n=1 Tax=Rhodococcus erythropolis TaxID=1833 RepID=UPI001F5299BE|nr:hypothetical protein [Rhodococcus erythropolis]
MTITKPRRPTLTGTSFTAGRAWTVTLLLLAFMLLNFADKAVLGFAGVHIMKDLGITPPNNSDFSRAHSSGCSPPEPLSSAP